MSFPYTGIGHVVVIVAYDFVRGFKVKSTDEEHGVVIWIPFDRMTWFQCFATEEKLKGVRFGPTTWDFAANKTIYRGTDRPRVIKELQNAHQNVTGEELNTDFTQREGDRILDFGFVLKFNKLAIAQKECANSSI